MKYKFNLNLSELKISLKEIGYYYYYPRVGIYSDSRVLIKKENNIVEIVKPISLLPLIEKYLNETPYPELVTTLAQSLTDEESEWYETLTDGLEWQLDNFIMDKKGESFFFFENTVVSVTAAKITMIPYSDLKKLVWKNQIVKHQFVLEDIETVKKSKFFEYIEGGSAYAVQCLSDELRCHLTSFIGCLLHNREETNSNRLLLLTDSTSYFCSDRSRKHILAQAVGKLTSAIYVDGNRYFDTKKLLKRLLPETRLVVIDNVIWIDLQELDRFLIDNPTLKIFLISNYPLTENPKTKYCFISGFSTEPEISNPNEYFKDWNNKDWNSMYSFFVYATQYYLLRGLVVSQNSGNHEFDTILKLTDSIFVWYLESYLKTEIDYPWEDARDGYNYFRLRLKNAEIEMPVFQQWVKAYADFKNYELIRIENIAEDLFRFKVNPPEE